MPKKIYRIELRETVVFTHDRIFAEFMGVRTSWFTRFLKWIGILE